jgi:hypothetical protein
VNAATLLSLSLSLSNEGGSERRGETKGFGDKSFSITYIVDSLPRNWEIMQKFTI